MPFGSDALALETCLWEGLTVLLLTCFLTYEMCFRGLPRKISYDFVGLPKQEIKDLHLESPPWVSWIWRPPMPVIGYASEHCIDRET